VPAALAHLEAHAAAICDKIEVMEVRVQLLLQLGRLTEAEAAVMDLLRRNPHNMSYYRWMEEAVGTAGRLELYARLRDQLPDNDCVFLQSLAAAAVASSNSDVFRAEMTRYFGAKLGRPAPGLFSSVKFLYKLSPGNAAIIGEVAVIFSEQNSGSPSQLVWCYHFLAQHCDMISEYSLGLDYIAKALELAPDLVDLYMVKAKLLKHTKETAQAAEAVAAAHRLDAGDRCVGSKYARYLLRAGHIGQAIKIMAKYTKVGKSNVVVTTAIISIRFIGYSFRQLSSD
jgi:tetratricopeptide (TPR) repeat protein